MVSVKRGLKVRFWLGDEKLIQSRTSQKTEHSVLMFYLVKTRGEKSCIPEERMKKPDSSLVIES
jgi:hypothetical protein